MIYQILTNKAFDYFITGIVIINALALCLYYYPAPDNLISACGNFHFILDIATDICNAIYVIETIMKILFYGKDYFMEGWNIYDFTCLFGTLFFRVFFKIIKLEHNPWRIFQTLFRVAKLLRLFHLLKILRRMFQTTVLALPTALNLAVLILLVNYIFAVIGVIFFATTKFQVDLNPQANYKDLLNAFLTVFRIASGDNWTVIMHDIMRTRTQYFECVYNPTYDDIQANDGETNGCGNSFLGAVYGLLIVIVINFIFLNLFVAIVVGSMLEINELSESVLSDSILDRYQQVWSKYDPNASGLIEYYDLWKFLCDLRKPLGVCKEQMPNRYYSAITLWMLDLKIYKYKIGDNVHCSVEFYDVLEALVKKTIYRPQTLNMIFHNKSKADLIDGLQKLWSEKSSLLIEDQEDLGKIEALSYYYTAKEASAKKGIHQLKRTQLPNLVWITLRITRTLKLMVRRRKGKNSDSTGLLAYNQGKERSKSANIVVQEIRHLKQHFVEKHEATCEIPHNFIDEAKSESNNLDPSCHEKQSTAKIAGNYEFSPLPIIKEKETIYTRGDEAIEKTSGLPHLSRPNNINPQLTIPIPEEPKYFRPAPKNLKKRSIKSSKFFTKMNPIDKDQSIYKTSPIAFDPSNDKIVKKSSWAKKRQATDEMHEILEESVKMSTERDLLSNIDWEPKNSNASKESLELEKEPDFEAHKVKGPRKMYQNMTIQYGIKTRKNNKEKKLKDFSKMSDISDE